MKRLEYVDVITAGLGEREGVRGLYEGQSHTAEMAFHGRAGTGPRAEIKELVCLCGEGRPRIPLA